MHTLRVSFGAPGRPIFLIGMMGSGKTTVGRCLAEHLGATFIDLDRRVERLFGESIRGLFSRGEDHFRRCERDALRALLAEPGFAERAVVVATGGGTVVDASNLADMRVAGLSVYLRVPVERLARRLSLLEREGRPLLDGSDSVGFEGRLAELLSARRASYDACDVTIDGDAEPEVVAARVLQVLEHSDHHG